MNTHQAMESPEKPSPNRPATQKAPSVARYLKTTLCGLLLLLIAYLLVVFLWASSVVDELLMATPSTAQPIPLQARHVAALIKIEDPTFYEHPGLDISAGQGVTTMTSVLARDLFLGHRDASGAKGAMQSFYRSVFQCCRKVDFGRDVMSLVLDSRTSQRQPRAMYVHGTYFGSLNGTAVIGFGAAAKAYYGKDPARLTDQEFYGLMAMPLAPNRYHPLRNAGLHAERAKRIAALVAGTCEPNGWLDLTYEDCATAPAKTTTPSSSA